MVPLRVLLVEDVPSDAELVVRVLLKAGYTLDWRRVDTEAAYLEGLAQAPDIIISDFTLPQFSALDALRLLQISGHDIPLIIVSGTIGDEIAVGAIRKGAFDYVLKDRPARLAESVRQALDDHRQRLERAAMAVALKEAEARYRDIFHNAIEGMYEALPDGTLVTANPALARIFAYDSVADFLHDITDIRKQLYVNPAQSEAFQRILQDQGMVSGFETCVRRRDGEVIWVSEQARLLPAANKLIGSSIDISARKSAEAARYESESRFRQLADNVNAVFWMSDLETNQMLYVSPGYERIWGRTCESLYAHPRSFLDAIHEEDRPSMLEAVDGEKEHRGGFEREYRIQRPDGTLRWIRDRGFPIRNEKGELFRVAGIAEDITESKNLERQFLQAQKMEAVGRLAGGVAHDFNNMLTAVLGYGEMILDSFDAEDPRRGEMEEVLAAGERASRLTRQLLAFSRQQVMEVRTVDLNEVITGLRNMLERLIGEDISLCFALSGVAQTVRADPGQLEQVVLNLAVNARDAMPDGGHLTLETTHETLERTLDHSHGTVAAGVYSVLTVRDTGSGMTDDVKACIFEPFFTTKESGKGTGLGLATCFGIVRQSSGSIVVESEPGQGTAIKIYLPRIEETPPVSTAVNDRAQARPGGCETLLLVEDEPAVRTLSAQTLRGLGYTVLEASHGVDALRVLDKHGAPISLVVTDVIMPQMGGRELFNRMRERGMTSRFLFCSGYTDRAIAYHGELEEGTSFLQKPYTPTSLAIKVRELLDQ